MSKQYKTFLVLVFGIFVGVSVSITSSVLAEKKTEQSVGLPLDELRNFSDIFARVKSDYVEEVDDKTLLENAIRGMLTGLDPHSTYLNTEEYKELKIGTTGKFGGLGIQVGMEDGFVKVISPIDDTPAYRAGLEAGDLIIRLNDKSVKGMTLNDAVKIMRQRFIQTVFDHNMGAGLNGIGLVQMFNGRLDQIPGIGRIQKNQIKSRLDAFKAVEIAADVPFYHPGFPGHAAGVDVFLKEKDGIRMVVDEQRRLGTPAEGLQAQGAGA